MLPNLNQLPRSLEHTLLSAAAASVAKDGYYV
jgi:hypothetical protein